MVDLINMLERFKRIKLHQESLQTVYIRVPFTEPELTELITLINEYIELRQYVENKEQEWRKSKDKLQDDIMELYNYCGRKCEVTHPQNMSCHETTEDYYFNKGSHGSNTHSCHLLSSLNSKLTVFHTCTPA